MIKLDYTLESPEERKALVEKIIAETQDITPAYLEILGNYLVLCMEKQERKERNILTDNRMTTVNKRECSFEGLVSQLENGEDGIYNLVNEDKNVIFQPKIQITQRDLDTIPYLKQLRDTINAWEAAAKHASGKDAFIMKKALIEMRKDQYLIKQAYYQPIVSCKLTKTSRVTPPLEDKSYLKGSEIVVKGISLMDTKTVSAVLCNYTKLKEDSWDQFDGDTWYLMQDFDKLCTKALADYPIYDRIVEWKIDGKPNSEIQKLLDEEFNQTYSVEYISSLWRNKIPKVIAEQAKEDFLIWEYTRRGYPMKKCSKCGQIKPANNLFFSKNKTSKDNWYSICKKCRNKKRG